MNAKTELLDILYGQANTLCAEIKTKKDKTIILKQNYSQEDWDNFAKELDFDYNNSSGDQFIHGTVWLQDNSWLKRIYMVGNFSSIEYWGVRQRPEIPEHLF